MFLLVKFYRVYTERVAFPKLLNTLSDLFIVATLFIFAIVNHVVHLKIIKSFGTVDCTHVGYEQETLSSKTTDVWVEDQPSDMVTVDKNEITTMVGRLKCIL